MSVSKQQAWERFKDLSKMDVSEDDFATMEPRFQNAFTDLAALEAGTIANPDKGWMERHYWLRDPALAPSPMLEAKAYYEVERTLSWNRSAMNAISVMNK